MRARLTYVPLDVAEQFDDFIIERDEQVLDAVKARTRDYSTLSLLKLLYQVRNNPITLPIIRSVSPTSAPATLTANSGVDVPYATTVKPINKLLT